MVGKKKTMCLHRKDENGFFIIFFKNFSFYLYKNKNFPTLHAHKHTHTLIQCRYTTIVCCEEPIMSIKE